MAEAHELDAGGAQRPADRSHRIHIVQQKGIGAELLHVPGQVEHHRDAPQAPEHTRRTARVGDTLIHAVFQRDLVVIFEALNASHLEGRDHIVGILDRFSLVGGDPHRCGQIIGLNHLLDKCFHVWRPPGAWGHEGELCVLKTLCRQDVQDQRLAKDDATSTYDSYLCHSIPPLRSTEILYHAMLRPCPGGHRITPGCVCHPVQSNAGVHGQC
jgi:hypothetical protein